MLRNLFYLLVGLFGGLWLVWPGITRSENWDCATEILLKSREERTDVRALLAVSPNYLLKNKNKDPISKIRIVGDACFR